ncbi:MAG: tRNA pseudouridine(38-40) synthase TruA [Chloroflexi bacterium]|nr:tRNA pseudouridine(38-40) synthase TruA [Chloroflexota bacterium]
MVTTAVNPELELVDGLKTTTRIVLIVEYNGAGYHGFQLQAGLPTIQGAIEEALEKLTGERVRVMAAGRTDAGVHALGQVVSFRSGPSHSLQTFVNGLNYYLPGDIAVKAAHRVKDSFSVRRHAVSREYHYYILNSLTRSPLREGFAYRLTGHLDIEAMNQVSQSLIGEHDFASFASSIEVELKSTLRRVYLAEMSQNGEMIVFKIVANSFLPHQVRNTVGALIRVGSGKMSNNEFCSIMAMKQPGLAGPTAPACGLCLMQVNYQYPFEDGKC